MVCFSCRRLLTKPLVFVPSHYWMKIRLIHISFFGKLGKPGYSPAAAVVILSPSSRLSPELDNPEARVTEIHTLVHRLPEKNRQMLELLMRHLAT